MAISVLSSLPGGFEVKTNLFFRLKYTCTCREVVFQRVLEVC